MVFATKTSTDAAWRVITVHTLSPSNRKHAASAPTNGRRRGEWRPLPLVAVNGIFGEVGERAASVSALPEELRQSARKEPREAATSGRAGASPSRLERGRYMPRRGAEDSLELCKTATGPHLLVRGFHT